MFNEKIIFSKINDVTPYLIQRGSFKEIKKEEIQGLDSLIAYEYMGSSEFEFGALPTSLQSICENWSSFTVIQIPEIKDVDKQYLYLVCHSSLIDKLKPVLNKLFTEEHPYHLKERADCYSYVIGKDIGSYFHTNFWWDIKNGWMACFGNNVQSLVIALQLVCRKKNLDPSDGPKVPSRVDYPSTFFLEIDKRKDIMTVTDYSAKVTIINLKKVVSYNEEEKCLTVNVISGKDGKEKSIVLNIPQEPKRDVIKKIIKEHARFNTSKRI